MSNIIIHTANGQEWGLVNIPKSAGSISVKEEAIGWALFYFAKRTRHMFVLNNGYTYSIFAKSDEITEDDAKQVVERDGYDDGGNDAYKEYCPEYFDPYEKKMCFDGGSLTYARASFQSLLRSHNLINDTEITLILKMDKI